MNHRVVVLSLVLAAALSFAMQAQAWVRPLVTQTVDDRDTIELPGNVRPEANATNDRGPVTDTLVLEHMQLLLQRPPETEAALDSAIERLYEKSSPDFHRWLDSQTLRDEFGPAQSDLDTITTWLGAHGMIVHGVLISGMIIDFSGSAAAVREAFHTEIHNLEVNGESRIANMSNPRIPAALAKVVNGVVSLNSFPAIPMLSTGRGSGGLGLPGYELAPGDLWTIYNFNPLLKAGITGKGQTIIVVEDSNVYSTADWTAFRSKFGLSGYTSASLKETHPTSNAANCTNPGVQGAAGEASLDVEWASAAAPNAAIVLASCADTNVSFGFLLAAENLIDSNSPPTILSMSYGYCEALLGASGNGAFNTVFQKGAALGTSIYVSSGDQLSGVCNGDLSGAAVTDGVGVNGMASTPYNVAAGGTDFADAAEGAQADYWKASNSSTYESAIKYPAEIPWNNSCASPSVGVFLELGLVTIPPLPPAYGKDGTCNSLGTLGDIYGINLSFLLGNSGGSGGPSACATGAPSVAGVVGGTCKGYPKPSWQKSLFGNPSDGVRDIPDVSLFASNGNVWGHAYVYCYSNLKDHGRACTGSPANWSAAGGTSFVAPILAGVQALINQKKDAKQGNPNPVYYALAKTEYGASGNSACNSSNARPKGAGVKSSCIFNDVTSEFGIVGTGSEFYDLGSIAAPCTTSAKSPKLYDCYRPSGTYGVLSTSNSSFEPAYPTTAGWDFATGIGSINVTNLVNGW